MAQVQVRQPIPIPFHHRENARKEAVSFFRCSRTFTLYTIGLLLLLLLLPKRTGGGGGGGDDDDAASASSSSSSSLWRTFIVTGLAALVIMYIGAFPLSAYTLYKGTEISANPAVALRSLKTSRFCGHVGRGSFVIILTVLPFLYEMSLVARVIVVAVDVLLIGAILIWGSGWVGSNNKHLNGYIDELEEDLKSERGWIARMDEPNHNHHRQLGSSSAPPVIVPKM